jgi:hypothetical protein
MSTLFSLTVTDQAQMSKAVEVQTVHQALLIAAQQVRSQKNRTSGNIVIEKGTVIGSWTYTGTATQDG